MLESILPIIPLVLFLTAVIVVLLSVRRSRDERAARLKRRGKRASVAYGFDATDCGARMHRHRSEDGEYATGGHDGGGGEGD